MDTFCFDHLLGSGLQVPLFVSHTLTSDKITPQMLNSSPLLITMGGYKFIIGKDPLIDN